MSIKRYYHGVVRWQVDPDFEESPDGDVVLWEDHEKVCAELRSQLADANALLEEADRNPRIINGWPDFARRIRAHLAAQPATDQEPK